MKKKSCQPRVRGQDSVRAAEEDREGVMKSSKLMLMGVAVLVVSVAMWAQSTSSTQANSSGQTSAQSSSNDQSSSSAQSSAGSPASPSGQSTSEQGASGSGANTTVRGCLTGGGGTYVLNSKDGSAYTLLGDGNALDKQINHEVEVSGTKVAAPVSSQPDTHNTAAGAPGHPSGNNFQVSQMREISDHCAIPK